MTMLHSDAMYHAQRVVEDWERRRSPFAPKRQKSYFTVYLPNAHYKKAIEAEAAIRNMSVNSFMRAMIKGYFAAALHGR